MKDKKSNQTKLLRFNDWKKQILENEEVKKEYEKLNPTMQLVRQLIELRIIHQLTQEDLARKLNTKQSVISRIESGKANPSLRQMQSLAKALNSRLEIRFYPL